jgi:hypothetical protein
MAQGLLGLADNGLKQLSADDILDSLGLVRKTQQTSWLWPAIGGVTIGLAAGIALGMAFAPKRGEELRGELGEKWKSRDYAGMADTARSAVTSAQRQVTGNRTGMDS